MKIRDIWPGWWSEAGVFAVVAEITADLRAMERLQVELSAELRRRGLSLDDPRLSRPAARTR